MLRKHAYFLVIGFLLLLTACSKNTSKPNGSSNSTQLVGSYDFLYMTTNINVTESVSLAGQTASVVILSGYKTEQNTGTVVFSADSAMGNGIGYSYDTTAMFIETQPGVGPDTTVQVLSGSVPPTTSTSKYQIIGTDSVYFPGGVLGTGAITAGAPITIAPPTGGHFTIKGDTLTITTKINQTYPDNINGIPTTATAAVNATIILLKQ
ncbi:MAG TPA: hypothetical protein VK518_13355 [Puia sp.]|nr:hypothetical protein [Puia sp.]